MPTWYRCDCLETSSRTPESPCGEGDKPWHSSSGGRPTSRRGDLATTRRISPGDGNAQRVRASSPSNEQEDSP